MFRLILCLALLSATAAYSAPATSTIPAMTTKKTEAEIEMVLNTTSREFTPHSAPPNDEHACFCVAQGRHCSPVLAASSGTCAHRTRRRYQTESCILRCARYCFYDAPRLGLCRDLRGWLEQKVYKLFRQKYHQRP